MKRLLFLVLLPLIGLPLHAQNADLRGLKTVVNNLEGQSVAVGRQYAVMIAIDRYNSWMTLQNPVKDAKEIKEILSRRYYISDFIELYDDAATKAGIIRLFDRLIRDTKPEDSVLIFYAGHGHLDKTSNTGFWIPVDGGMDVYEQANWLPNSQIRGFITNMKARHVALIADSCFSGDFLNPSRGIGPTITNEYFKKAYARISRQVLTSGASESVPDASPFTRQLKLTLEGNTAPYLDPLMLYNEVRLGVTKTTPLFGDLKDTGHQEGSSFLLFLREDAVPRSAPQESAAEPSTKIKIAKAYGTATVETDSQGTLFLDGVSQGQIPVGSLATIENISAGPHTMEMLYDDGQKVAQTVTIRTGKAVSVEFSRPASADAPARVVPAQKAQPQPVKPAPAKSEPAQPAALLNGAPLPEATMKIDGKFDDWRNIPPVAAGLPQGADSSNVSTVFLASDADNLYIRLDVADTTSGTTDNFKKAHDSPSYGMSIDTGRGRKNLSVRLFYMEPWGVGWGAEIGTLDKGLFVKKTASAFRFAMKGPSAEIAIPVAKIRDLLGDLGEVEKYRVVGWSAKGGTPTSDSGAKDPRNWTNIVDKLVMTDAGFFTWAENKNVAAPASQTAPQAARPELAQPVALLNGAPLPQATIKIDGKFDDWQNIPPVAAGLPQGADSSNVSTVFLASDGDNLYIRLDVADTTPGTADNFRKAHDSPSYGMSIDTGRGRKNLSVRLFYTEPFGGGWGAEIGTLDNGLFKRTAFGFRFAMKGPSAEIAIPAARIRDLLGDLGDVEKYRVVGWSAKGGTPSSESGAKDPRNWTNIVDKLVVTDAGSVTWVENKNVAAPAP